MKRPSKRHTPRNPVAMAALTLALAATGLLSWRMKRLIREFGQKLKAGGSRLFYYAGHGVQSKGRNYLVRGIILVDN